MACSPLGFAQTAVKPAVTNRVNDIFTPIDYGQAKLAGYLGERLSINLEKRLLPLNTDTLLQPFKARSGGQWWLGEHLGKFLHAGSCAWKLTGNEALKRKLDDAAAGLNATQLPDGYLGTYPERDRFVERDGISWDGPVWDVWAHKYCLIGLLTYYGATGSEPALQASRKAADLLCSTFGPGKKSIGLASSHMGMASTSVLEPMAMLSRLTGEPRYLEFCQYLVDSWEQPPAPRILTSLLAHGNVYRTANNKAYEMLSNLVGLMELYRLVGDPRYLRACEAAWNDIAARRLYPVGTTSYAEHFTDDFDLPSEARPGDAEPKIGEGCVTVTWLQLNLELLRVTGETKYAAALERTIYNALPAAQCRHTGQVCYFLPLNGHRRFGEVSHGLRPDISCCSSSIPRGLALIPECVAGTMEGQPVLLQYEPGTFVLPVRRGQELVPVELRVRTDYPASGRVQVELHPSKPMPFTLGLRVPEWADEFVARRGDRARRGTPGEMLRIYRTWAPGDTLDITIALRVQERRDPNKGSTAVYFTRGPQVLAREGLAPANGTVAEAELIPFAEAGQQKQPYTTVHPRP